MQASQVAREASQQTQGDFKVLEAESRSVPAPVQPCRQGFCWSR